MKRIASAALLALLLLTGCGGNATGRFNAAGTQAVGSAESGPEPAASQPEEASALEENGTAHGLLAERMDGPVVYIKENLFIAQTNDIYYNIEDYLGRTIEYEGYFDFFIDEDNNDMVYYFVVRNGPGCCGYDGKAGFEVVWEDTSLNYPKSDTWVRAQGVLEIYVENGMKYPRLVLTELEPLEVRGLDTVVN